MMRANERPETILMTTDAVGGVWIYALELARALGKRGTNVVLASMGEQPSEEQRAAAAEIETLTLVSRSFKLEWMNDPWIDLERAGDWLLEIEARYRPDVIHLNNYAHGALSWSAPVLVVGHSCVCSWFHAVRGEAPPEEWSRYREVVRRGLQGADAVTAPTDAMLRELCRHYGAFASAGVVYNARRTEDLQPLSPEPFALTAGRLWDEAKNMNVLDAAAGLIEWPVYAAGSVDNPDGGSIHLEQLRLLGSIAPSELGRWMGRASIYVLPARYEPFGLTALEAAHAGCALVLGDIPTLREVWGDAAVFVAPNDREAIAREVNMLSQDAERRHEMARRARRRAARYTIDRKVNGYVELYCRLGQTVRKASDRPKSRVRNTSNRQTAAEVTP